MKTSKALLGVVAVAIAGGVLWWLNRPAAPVKFETAEVTSGNLESVVTATGNVNPIHLVGVGAQISGVITKLNVDYESKVKKGDLLAEIDPRPLQDVVTGAQADVDVAQAGVTSARAAVKAADQAVAEAVDELDRYRALSKQFASVQQHLQLEYDRQKGLGAIASADDLASAKAALDAAVQDTVGAEGQVSISEANIDERKAERDAALAQLSAAEAQLKQTQAALATAVANLKKSQILSPIDGTVIVMDVAVGQAVAASMQVPELFQIAEDLSKVQVDVDIDESDVSRVHVGDPATFSVDAYPGRMFDASVREIRKNATNINNVISYDVVCSIPQQPEQLFPGMTANIRIVSAKHDGVVKVPNAALRFRPPDRSGTKEKTIFVLNASGKMEPRIITTGITDGRETEITSPNVQPGDRVVTAEVL
jgi:HlyD family secretion protein